MIPVTLYTRKDCPLCDEAQEHLAALQNVVPHELTVVDINSDPKLLLEYEEKIPVVVAGPYTLKAPINPKDLEITLKAVEHRDQQIAKIDADIASGEIYLNLSWKGPDRFSLWMGKHYLAFMSALIALYLFGAFLPALLMQVNLPAPAHILYKAYSFVCHQLPYRSWFLFGEQAAYPRKLAGVEGLMSFEEATGISEGGSAEEIWAARSYVGNEYVGYKVALCERDVAIYGGMLIFAALFALWRKFQPNKSWRSIHWLIWVLVGIFPMGLDGGSQLIGQYFPQITQIIPIRESTPFLRTLTGFLFGFFTAWFGVPYMDESFAETRRIFERKRMLYEQQEKRMGEGVRNVIDAKN